MFTDPTECSCHGDKLVNGNCHKCNVRLVLNAAITANVKAGRLGIAISQLRMIGF
jgi:hypothetical protein